MTNNGQFTDSRRKEDEFFYQHDQELILAARRQAESEARLRDLGGVTRISDRQILGDLQRVGYTAQTAVLFDLVPLVQVAWSDGSVKEQERERIFTIARLDGMEDADPNWGLLEQYLETRPSDEFFHVTLRALRAFFESFPLSERGRMERKFISRCTSVAAVSRGFLGIVPEISEAEKSAISEIVAALSDHFSGDNGRSLSNLYSSVSDRGVYD